MIDRFFARAAPLLFLMPPDADPLVSAVSRCILSFSEQRGRGKGEAQEDTATLYTALPSGTSAGKGVRAQISTSAPPHFSSSLFRERLVTLLCPISSRHI